MDGRNDYYTNSSRLIVNKTSLFHTLVETSCSLISSQSSSFQPLIFLVVLSGPFRDCLEAQEAGHSTSGMYLIRPDEMERPLQVWCEQDIDNGGWTVIQTRKDGSINFFRNWDNYKVMKITLPPCCLSCCSLFS